MNNLCNYTKSWVGRCRNQKPCTEHANIKCGVCGDVSTRECDYSNQFVCRYPLCDTCAGVGSGYSHKHKDEFQIENTHKIEKNSTVFY